MLLWLVNALGTMITHGIICRLGNMGIRVLHVYFALCVLVLYSWVCRSKPTDEKVD